MKSQILGKKIRITKKMIEKGYKQNIIHLGTPSEDTVETVCWIGNFWFYFGGLLAETMRPEQYKKEVPEEDIIQSIVDALKTFERVDALLDEYEYYYWFLKENLK